METNGNGNGHSHEVLWLETESGKRIQERLNQEATLKALDHLLDRLDTIENAVERLAGVIEQGPGLVSMAADSADELITDAHKQGIDIQERAQNSLHLLERLTSKETTQKLDQLMMLTDQLPGLIAMGMDSADEGYRHLEASGVDLTALAKVTTSAGAALSAAEKEEAQRVGVFGLLRAMKDPDRQKAMGFLMNFLKNLGKKL